MIKKYTIALLMILGMSILISQTTPKAQEKEYPATLTLPEWNVLILSVNSPDDVSANNKKAVLNKLIPQLNSQLRIEDSLSKVKHIQDSLKNKK